MAHLLGIDCGGTSTRAVLVSEGRPIWSGAGGPGNLSSSPDVEQSIGEAVSGCPKPDAVCAAFAGLVTREQHRSAAGLLESFFPDAAVTAVPDFEAALIACGREIDVCVLAGTGSLVCSFIAGKEIVRSGGKGYLLGDEGSAFQYGRDALLHFLEGPRDDISSRLVEDVGQIFGTTARMEVISGLYSSAAPAKLIASLSEAFAHDTEAGALYALKSLRIHSGKLAHIVAKHLRQYHPQLKSVRIGCQGGLWSGAIFRDAFVEQLAFWCKVDEIEVDFEVPAPVFGAAEIAGRLL